MDRPTIEQLDADGAIREGMDAVRGDRGARFLARGVAATGGLVGAVA